MERRNTSFELMRILSMLMVCAFHWQLHGFNDSISRSELCINQVISFIFGSWGILGVNLFFLLSFYFLIKKDAANYVKIIGLIIKVSLWGTSIYVIGILIGATEFSFVEFIKSILGVLAYQYWFIAVYIVIAILSPIINQLLRSLAIRECFILMGIMFYVTYIVSWALGNEIVGRLSCGMTIYILIYILENKLKTNWFETYRRLAIPSIILGIMGEILLSYLGTNYNPLFYKVIGKIQTTASPYMLIVALLVFYSFKNFELSYNGIINFLGKYSSGAYLLHGGTRFIKGYLWDGLFQVGKYYQADCGRYILHYAICILSIFFFGVFCDVIYSYTIGRAVNTLLCTLKLKMNILVR